MIDNLSTIKIISCSNPKRNIISNTTTSTISRYKYNHALQHPFLVVVRERHKGTDHQARPASNTVSLIMSTSSQHKPTCKAATYLCPELSSIPREREEACLSDPYVPFSTTRTALVNTAMLIFSSETQNFRVFVWILNRISDGIDGEITG